MYNTRMNADGSIVLYHGTDWESALEILNHGLNIAHLRRWQVAPTQLGEGWYTTEYADIAWYFASIAPGVGADDAFTIIEMVIHAEHLESLLDQQLAIRETIINVLFQGEQIWFHPDTFDFLNQNALFRPYSDEI